MINPQIADKNIIFAADLPENITEEELRQFFNEYLDKIIIINLNSKKNQNYEKQSTTAKIIFRDSNTANEARLNLNQLKLKGRAIRLMWDEKTQIFKNNINNTNLFIKGIPINISQRKVFEYFLQFGDILSMKMSEDKYGNHIGYGYITYYKQESASKAIESCDGKIIFNSRLDVKFFKKKAERIASYAPENTKIYITNFPGNFNENDIITLCEDYGEIISYYVNSETIGRIYAIICYSNPESAKAAQIALNKKNIKGYNLYCEIYQNKIQLNNNKETNVLSNIKDANKNKNKYEEYCNLIVKNIPYQVDEETLKKLFEPYGPILSIKIKKYSLIQKIKNEFKEIPTSEGYGFVCFHNKNDALNAKNELNGKYVPKYESWIRPLVVEYSLPRKEKELYKNNQNLPFDQRIMNNQFQYNPNYVGMYMNDGKYNPAYLNNQNFINNYNNGDISNQNKKDYESNEKVDEKYLMSLETLEDKKEYLGEFIFKLIEEHPLAQKYHLTMNMIEKITGMIINIDNLNEILDVCNNENTLISRINEAYDLINSN